MLAFLFFFLIMNFFLILNFMIAIVVDSYSSVKAEIREDDSEKTLLTDLWCVHVAAIKQPWYGWPSTEEAIERLEKLKSGGVTFPVAVRVFENQSRDGVRHWLKYYHDLAKHLRKAPAESKPLHVDMIDKVAFMLEKPVPTEVQVLTQRRLCRRWIRSNSATASTIPGGVPAPAEDLLPVSAMTTAQLRAELAENNAVGSVNNAVSSENGSENDFRRTTSGFENNAVSGENDFRRTTSTFEDSWL